MVVGVIASFQKRDIDPFVHAYVHKHDCVTIAQHLRADARLPDLHDQFNTAAALPAADKGIDEWIVESMVDDGQRKTVYVAVWVTISQFPIWPASPDLPLVRSESRCSALTISSRRS